MTYLAFHLLFLLPPILALAMTMPQTSPRGAWWSLTAIPLLALVYTTPWDSELIRRGVWTYNEWRVMGTVWRIPLEEYLFFLLQPTLIGLWVLRMAADMSWRSLRRGSIGGRLRRAAGLLLVAGGAASTLHWESLTYLRLILVWALPVIGLQWAWGWGLFAGAGRRMAIAIIVPTVYLWTIDRLAIGLGLWTISPRLSIGWSPLGLPVEEGVFFLVTTVLCVQGQWAVLWVANRRQPGRLVTAATGLRRVQEPVPG